MNHGPTLQQGRRSRKTQGHVSVSRALISVFGTTLQCGFTQKKTQRMQHGAGVSQGGTQPTQHPQPCHHCGHFPNPLSQELPCSSPLDPSILREYDSSLHMPKYHRWPWDWGLCPHLLPEIKPKTTHTSRTLAWVLLVWPGGCHGVMLGQGNASTSPIFTPSLLFQCQEQYPVRADPRPGAGAPALGCS